MRLSTIFVPFLLLQGAAIIAWQIVGGFLLLWELAAWLVAAPTILAFAMIRARRRGEPKMSVAGNRGLRMPE